MENGMKQKQEKNFYQLHTGKRQQKEENSKVQEKNDYGTKYNC